MNAYNPLDATKSMEAAGLDRRQAEAIARVIGDSKNDLVTGDTLELKLEAALSRQLVRFGALMTGLIAAATAIVSVVNGLLSTK